MHPREGQDAHQGKSGSVHSIGSRRIGITIKLLTSRGVEFQPIMEEKQPELRTSVILKGIPFT